MERPRPREGGFALDDQISGCAARDLARRTVGMQAAELAEPQRHAPITARFRISDRSDDAVRFPASDRILERGVPSVVDDHVLVHEGDPFGGGEGEASVARRSGIEAFGRVQHRHAVCPCEARRGIARAAVRDDDTSDGRLLAPQGADDAFQMRPRTVDRDHHGDLDGRLPGTRARSANRRATRHPRPPSSAVPGVPRRPYTSAVASATRSQE